MKNVFHFDQYDAFRKKAKVIDSQLSVRDIIDELTITKQATHKLSKSEENRRDVLTFNLFKFMENYRYEEDRELTREEKNDPEFINARVIRFKTEPSTGLFEDIRKVLPTRFHKKFVHALINTGYGISTKEKSYFHKIMLYCDTWGMSHEYQTLRALEEKMQKVA